METQPTLRDVVHRVLARWPRGLLVASALLLPVTLRLAATRPTDVTPSLSIAAPQHVSVNQPMSIAFNLKDASDVGGFEMTVLYDTSAVEYDGLHQLSSDLGHFGRGIQSFSAERQDGISFGLYSCPFSKCVSPPAGETRQTTGASGTLHLTDLLLVVHRPALIEVRIAEVKVTAPDGTPISVDVPTSSFEIEVGAPHLTDHYPAPTPPSQPTPQTPTAAPGPFDVTGEGRVDYADSVQAALDWTLLRRQGKVCGSAPNTRTDVSHDACLDIADMQLITDHFDAPAAALTETPTPSSSPVATGTVEVTPTPGAEGHHVYLPYTTGGRDIPAPSATPAP
ncbi:MAG: hypothetical protein U0822_14540 [Anaerolineae bacterium]